MRMVAAFAIGISLWAAAPATAGEPSAARFAMHDAPRSVSDVRFKDGARRSVALADMRGRIILLNVWATWCGPCRREMPTLDRVQAELGGTDFEVVALSIDRAGPEAVRKFFAETGVRRLALYIDESGRAARDLGAIGLPTTLLLDRDGRELGRLVGAAEWDTPEMIGFLKGKIGSDSAKPREVSGSAPPAAGSGWVGRLLDRFR